MRVLHTLAACALAATLPCAPPLTFAAANAATAGAAQQPAPQRQPPPQQPAPRPAPTPAGVGPVDDEEVLSVDTSLVNVVFNATDRERRFVTTLRREDVQVFEDGVPQEVAVFQRETELPLSIAILVDVSVSQENTLPVEKDAARAFINQILRPGKDAAAIISFTGSATLEQDMTQDRGSLHFAIDNLRVILPPKEQDAGVAPTTAPPAPTAVGTGAGVQIPAASATPDASVAPPAVADEDADIGHTSVWDAVWVTSNEVLAHTPSHTRRAIILLSDGADTKSRLKREAAAEAAVKANAVVYSVGIEPYSETEDYELDKKALRRIAEATGGRAFFPKDETEVNAAFHQIQQELRTQYLAAYTPTN
ncbi:MAG: VWA domain-containing protein, partial [Acidobacteria bacterium]|nr:VWA domain-containing protein [Acidobacteriota bacterium]